LSKLVLSRRQIAGLAVTFGLGAITIVVSILRFVSVMNHRFLPLCEFCLPGPETC
jgi:hypothetical protein